MQRRVDLERVERGREDDRDDGEAPARDVLSERGRVRLRAVEPPLG